MGNIPVFLINNHRIDSVADAEAYVARLREVERVMGEIGANMRHQAELGIVPPRFNFAPVREDGRRILAGAPFADGAGQRRCSPTSRPRSAGSQIAAGREGPADRRRARGADRPVPPRLRDDARDAGRDRAARARQRRRLEPARRRRLLRPAAAPIDDHRPRPPSRSTGSASTRSRASTARWSGSRRQVGFTGTLQQFFAPHQRGPASSNIRTPTRAGSTISPTPAASSPR